VQEHKKHERRDDVIIVTAQPKAIQAFLLSIAQEPRA